MNLDSYTCTCRSPQPCAAIALEAHIERLDKLRADIKVLQEFHDRQSEADVAISELLCTLANAEDAELTEDFSAKLRTEAKRILESEPAWVPSKEKP